MFLKLQFINCRIQIICELCMHVLQCPFVLYFCISIGSLIYNLMFSICLNFDLPDSRTPTEPGTTQGGYFVVKFWWGESSKSIFDMCYPYIYIPIYRHTYLYINRYVYWQQFRRRHVLLKKVKSEIISCHWVMSDNDVLQAITHGYGN